MAQKRNLACFSVDLGFLLPFKYRFSLSPVSRQKKADLVARRRDT